MTKEKVTSLESIETLSKAVEENKQRIRQLKRAESELRLQMAVKNINSDKEDEQREVLRACYDYIAQHRVLFRRM